MRSPEVREYFTLSEDLAIADSMTHSDSNVLITISKGESKQTIHYNNGKFGEIATDNLIEEQEPAANVAKQIKNERISKYATKFGYVLAVVLLGFSALSFSGVLKARIVLTGSMAPAINTGAVIITTPTKYKSPKIGDVVTYEAKRFNGDPVAVFSHRIIGGDAQNGFIVKGDRNKLPDSQKPKSSDILGVVIMAIPFIGNLLTPKALFLIVPCIFGFWLILDAMKNVE